MSYCHLFVPLLLRSSFSNYLQNLHIITLTHKHKLSSGVRHLLYECHCVELQLLSSRRHVIAYWPNLRSVVRHFVSVTADDAAVFAPAAVRSRDFVGTVNSQAKCNSSSSRKLSSSSQAFISS